MECLSISVNEAPPAKVPTNAFSQCVRTTRSRRFKRSKRNATNQVAPKPSRCNREAWPVTQWRGAGCSDLLVLPLRTAEAELSTDVCARHDTGDGYEEEALTGASSDLQNDCTGSDRCGEEKILRDQRRAAAIATNSVSPGHPLNTIRPVRTFLYIIAVLYPTIAPLLSSHTTRTRCTRQYVSSRALSWR